MSIRCRSTGISTRGRPGALALRGSLTDVCARPCAHGSPFRQVATGLRTCAMIYRFRTMKPGQEQAHAKVASPFVDSETLRSVAHLPRG